MDDEKIIGLYFSRSEEAVKATSEKYGNYCFTVAKNILNSAEDAEECVNDTYEKAWNSIPPKHPENLRVYLGKITRNLALNVYEKYNAQKRGFGQLALALDELGECVPDGKDVEKTLDDGELKMLLNKFLELQKEDARKIFVKRYWFLSPVKDIAKDLGFSESKVRMTLHRERKSLQAFLESEGVLL